MVFLRVGIKVGFWPTSFCNLRSHIVYSQGGGGALSLSPVVSTVSTSEHQLHDCAQQADLVGSAELIQIGFFKANVFKKFQPLVPAARVLGVGCLFHSLFCSHH